MAGALLANSFIWLELWLL